MLVKWLGSLDSEGTISERGRAVVTIAWPLFDTVTTTFIMKVFWYDKMN